MRVLKISLISAAGLTVMAIVLAAIGRDQLGLASLAAACVAIVVGWLLAWAR